MKKILVTGAAGFIGFHLVEHLLKEQFQIIGVDSINDYYDVKLKFDRLESHGIYIDQYMRISAIGSSFYSILYPQYKFYHILLEDEERIKRLFETEKPDIVINLAAQAGVRYSLYNPRAYVKSNIDGFLNILEGCRSVCIEHLIYASSSSVYGLNNKTPFTTKDAVDHPVSLYAATKKSNELMAHTYSHLFEIKSTGLRFFTVYGPWGRPDMAIFLFTKAIINNEPIQVFNNGDMIRDFTFIADIVESIRRLIDKPPVASTDTSLLLNPDTSTAPFRILNIGNNKPIKLMDFIDTLQTSIGKKAIIENKPMQAGDVKTTHADVEALEAIIGYTPSYTLKEGVDKFVQWYRDYYKV